MIYLRSSVFLILMTYWYVDIGIICFSCEREKYILFIIIAFIIYSVIKNKLSSMIFEYSYAYLILTIAFLRATLLL